MRAFVLIALIVACVAQEPAPASHAGPMHGLQNAVIYVETPQKFGAVAIAEVVRKRLSQTALKVYLSIDELPDGATQSAGFIMAIVRISQPNEQGLCSYSAILDMKQLAMTHSDGYGLVTSSANSSIGIIAHGDIDGHQWGQDFSDLATAMATEYVEQNK